MYGCLKVVQAKCRGVTEARKTGFVTDGHSARLLVALSSVLTAMLLHAGAWSSRVSSAGNSEGFSMWRLLSGSSLLCALQALHNCYGLKAANRCLAPKGMCSSRKYQASSQLGCSSSGACIQSVLFALQARRSVRRRAWAPWGTVFQRTFQPFCTGRRGC